MGGGCFCSASACRQEAANHVHEPLAAAMGPAYSACNSTTPAEQHVQLLAHIHKAKVHVQLLLLQG